MTKQLDFLYIATVSSKDADTAHRFHKRMAKTADSHLWGRNEEYIKKLIDDGCLFGLWIGAGKKLVALCYVALSKTKSSWEIGGMVVDDTLKQRKIGSILVRFALAHTIVHAEPWEHDQKLIAHVHEGNEEPRRLIDKLGFQYTKTVEIPESENPPATMKRNAVGKVVGDEFEFPPAASKALSTWFHDDLNELMQQLKIEFGFIPGYDLEAFKTALQEIADRYR